MTVHCHRNTSDRRLGFARLPVRQAFIWFGPLFVRIAPKKEV